VIDKQLAALALAPGRAIAWPEGEHPSALGAYRLCHFMAIWATGERDTLICRVPVSTKPIMASAPTSVEIVINRPLRSLIAPTNNSPARNREPPRKQGEALYSRSAENRRVRRPACAFFRLEHAIVKPPHVGRCHDLAPMSAPSADTAIWGPRSSPPRYSRAPTR
jgi:hypothetical protein